MVVRGYRKGRRVLCLLRMGGILGWKWRKEWLVLWAVKVVWLV